MFPMIGSVRHLSRHFSRTVRVLSNVIFCSWIWSYHIILNVSHFLCSICFCWTRFTSWWSSPSATNPIFFWPSLAPDPTPVLTHTLIFLFYVFLTADSSILHYVSLFCKRPYLFVAIFLSSPVISVTSSTTFCSFVRVCYCLMISSLAASISSLLPRVWQSSRRQFAALSQFALSAYSYSYGSFLRILCRHLILEVFHDILESSSSCVSYIT